MKEEIVSQAGDSATVRPEGDLVMSQLPALRSRLRELVGAGASRLTLDLSEVKAVDSSGIGLVVSTHNSLKKAGGKLEVTGASKDVLELFQAMHIHQHMAVSGRS
jgi:anti-sigma B factor antagonist